MPERLALPCWAKLNYTLDVLSQRPDGFHDLSSVVQTVSLYDRLEIELAAGPAVELACDAPGVPPGESNLAVRAARAIATRAGYRGGVRLKLRKRIPAQAGLGGGSSDAAQTLRGLDRLLGLNLPAPDLAALAAELGSDVPLFLTAGTCRMDGRGDRVTPLPEGPTLWFVIARPPVGLSTAEAYARLDAIPDRRSARATERMVRALASGVVEEVTAAMVNDFEQVAIEMEPRVAVAMDDLRMARARKVRLCGSGSAVFGVAHSEAEAQAVAALARLRYPDLAVCRAVSRAEALVLGADAE
ncbi:MAG TPA: 4-(cytidine 5'-diphospho)-2-C-methyl-D-erythritol kinase [Chthonomonadales bacterium]|nr:4-(cytidine 5'-diphospho)-2-C-methyl-D-erythritol kinase [Chthonomonadales bacterium]